MTRWPPDRTPHIEDIKKRKRGEHPDGKWWHGMPADFETGVVKVTVKPQKATIDDWWDSLNGRNCVGFRYTECPDGSVYHKPVYRVKCGRQQHVPKTDFKGW